MEHDELEEIQEIFSHFDRDGNGTIDAEEFGALMEALGAEMSDEELEIGLTIIDANGNGQVEFDEFIDWWTTR